MIQILKYILKRILQTIPLLIIVSLISFFIIRLSPVDPLAELRLNPSVSKETKKALGTRLIKSVSAVMKSRENNNGV